MERIGLLAVLACVFVWSQVSAAEAPVVMTAAQVAQAAVQVQSLYRSLGAADRFRVVYSNQAHCFPAWVQPEAFDWLEYWLKGEG